MITIPEMEFQGGLPDGGLLAGCLRQQLAGAGRLARLYAYYRGEHDIQGRVRGAGLPNLRLAHAYPRYISTMASGYLIGDPVRYEAPGQEEALAALLRAYGGCAIDSVDAELARAASICGKGVELLYADERARPCAACSGRAQRLRDLRRHAWKTGRCLGMSYMPVRLPDGQLAGYRVQVYTDSSVLTYRDDLAGGGAL